MSIEKSLKNAMLTGNGVISFRNNAPTQYNSKQRQYFSPETRTFTQAYAQYSSDFVEAKMQGINPDDPYEWQTRLIRFAEIVKPTAAIQRHFDDYKMILVADRDIEYITPGAKIITMGSTWLAVNPMNVSGSDGTGLIRRCNAVWNYLDYYGNVVSEPIIVENFRANANDNDVQQSMYLTKGYFNVTCQYNDMTRQIDTNTRLILGTAAYRVTGFSDFEQEFTGNYSSVRLLYFTVRFEETNEAIDDMENHVAGGKSFTWNVTIDGNANLHPGDTAKYVALSERNGEPVTSDKTHQIWYIWESSDENVATVDAFGNVTAESEGTAEITATLAQNQSNSATISVVVTDAEDGVSFDGTIPAVVEPFDEVTLTAYYYEDGVRTDNVVDFQAGGADDAAYATIVNGNSITIKGYGFSATPLSIAASYGGYTANVEIGLGGV